LIKLMSCLSRILMPDAKANGLQTKPINEERKKKEMKKPLVVVNRPSGLNESSWIGMLSTGRHEGGEDCVRCDNGSPRRFTKKGAFSYLRTHGEKSQITIMSGEVSRNTGDCWIGVVSK